MGLWRTFHIQTIADGDTCMPYSNRIKDRLHGKDRCVEESEFSSNAFYFLSDLEGKVQLMNIE
jgi:hypothetical protein